MICSHQIIVDVEKGKESWDTIKRLVSVRSEGRDPSIVLSCRVSVLNKHNTVGQKFNEYFTSVTNCIG